MKWLLVLTLTPGLLLAQTSRQPVPNERLMVKEDITLYSLPGYDYQSYQASQTTFETLREHGITDLIPKKMAWPSKDDSIVFISQVNIPGGEADDVFYQVRYQSPNGERIGYARASSFTFESPRPPASVNTAPSQPPPSGSSHAASSQVACMDCKRHNLSAVCQSATFKDLAEDIQNFASDFKNREDLAEYFYRSRKSCRDTHHNKYLEQYQSYIQEASEAFQVPEALLSCLLFKENQWDQTTSSSGALGIAQFMPNTIRYTSNIIRELETSPARISELQDLKTRYLNAVQENLRLKQRGQTQKTIPPQWRKDFEFANTKLKNYSLAMDWKTYIDNLKDNDTFNASYSKRPWTGDYPTVFNSQRAHTPPLAIGMSALYLKEIIANFQESFDDAVLEGRGQVLPFLVAISGAYNMGPGNAARAIGNPPPAKASEWVERLKTNPETAKHMESIKRCMENGNTKPPLAIGRGGKLVEQNLCPN